MMIVHLLVLAQVSQLTNGSSVDPFRGGLNTPLVHDIESTFRPVRMCILRGINEKPLNTDSNDDRVQQAWLSQLKVKCDYPAAVEVALKRVQRDQPTIDETFARTRLDELMNAEMIADAMALASEN